MSSNSQEQPAFPTDLYLLALSYMQTEEKRIEIARCVAYMALHGKNISKLARAMNVNWRTARWLVRKAEKLATAVAEEFGS